MSLRNAQFYMYIDEKFKEVSPQETVDRIKSILSDLGIELVEVWNDSGIENCWSLNVSTSEGFPYSNGKGITRDFARASAYAEYIERLQSGLFFYKLQSFECDPEVNIQTFAPDGKYMTVEELAENGEWMDYIIEAYGGNLNRKIIAQQCAMYAHTNDRKVLTIPFYSIFEKKYVYLPAGFVEHVFATNGCCAGNSKEEALVHAFSEIMERKGSVSMLTSGKALPEIPNDILDKFPTVSKILKTIRENEDLDVKIFDCSIGNGFPVISTRIINKKTHSYLVNVAADPILEIAIQRTLTEIFQSRNIRNFESSHTGMILNNVSDFSISSNVWNQLERSGGIYTADYFADEITCQRKCTEFEDNSKLNNAELLNKLLSLYKDLNKPLYIRNYNYLGFPCYKVVVPGFSEANALKLNDLVQDYAMADKASKVLRNPAAATDADLNLVLIFRKMIINEFGRANNFSRLSGIPLSTKVNFFLVQITLAYCAYRTKNYRDTLTFLNLLYNYQNITENDKNYIACVIQYLKLLTKNIDKNKIQCILYKFHRSVYVDNLYKALSNGTPFDDYILKCDTKTCSSCKYKQHCSYDSAKKIVNKVSSIYNSFIDGQNTENFI